MREVGFEPSRAADGAWYGEAMSAAEARDLADADADSAPRAGARCFLASATAARRVLHAARHGDGVGQVEEVYTAAAHRGRGLGQRGRPRGDRGVRDAATTCDDPGRRRRLAQRLYERLGFETVDAYRRFTRKPDELADRQVTVDASARSSAPPARVVGRLRR